MESSELKLSRYTICSTRTGDGRYVLLHGITGAVDVVDPEIVAGLTRFGRFRGAMGADADVLGGRPAGNIRLSDAEIRVMRDRGYLTPDPEESEIAIASTIAGALHSEAAKQPSFLVLPTLDCNYRCIYCFERPVQNNLKKSCGTKGVVASHATGNVVMTRAHVDAIYRTIPILQERHGDTRKAVQIVLYGGEPLDARNADVVHEIVERGTAEGHRFAVITNGHDIPAFLGLFGPHAIQQVQVSIDGPKPVHDLRRIHLGRESSFDRVTRNIDLLEERGDTLIQIRVHVDPKNIGDFEELIEYFDSRGWLNHPNILVYANTVYNTGNATLDLDDIESRLAGLVQQYDNVLLNAPAINLRAKMLPALLRGLQVPLQGNYCSANTGQYLFSPDGHFYSCWESVGKQDSRIGSYYTPQEGAHLHLDEVATADWFTRHAGRIDECRACPMALTCGGGCAQFAKYRTGEQRAPYCDSFDKIFRKALAQMIDTYETRINETEAAGVGLVRTNYG